jgi:hypothetical protein
MNKENKLFKFWNLKIRKRFYLVISIYDTRASLTDFAITPYLYAVWFDNSTFGAKGLGLCWGFFAVHFAFASIKEIKELGND